MTSAGRIFGFWIRAAAAFALVMCPWSAGALTDATGETATSALGLELDRSVTTAHFEVFYNTPEDEPAEGVTASSAADAGTFAECVWSFYTDPPGGAYAFRRLRDLNHLNIAFDEDVLKIPIWARASVCNDCTDCSPECLGSTHGGSAAPRMYLSPLGPVFGCTANVCGAGKTANCCEETYWGRTATGYCGVILHEFAHVLFKAYNRYFNGGAVQLLNEGLPSGIMTVPLSTFHTAMDPKSVRNADLDAHLDLSNRSLREPGNNYREAPVFWYFLGTEYTRITDDAPHAWEDLSEACREYAGAIGLAAMNRIPGRDVIFHLQEELAACHPYGLATPGCEDPATGGDLLDVRCASYGRDGAVLDPGCIPNPDPNWTTNWRRPWDPTGTDEGKGEYLDRIGEAFMPRLMDLIDGVLTEYHGMIPDGTRYQAFRRFVEWNFLKDPTPEAFRDGMPGDLYPFRVKSFGAHYHTFDLTSDDWVLHLEKDVDLPVMASAVFFVDGDELVELAPWSTEAPRDIAVYPEYHRAVLMVTAFEGTYDPEGRTTYANSGGHYRLDADRLSFAPDVFDDGDATTPAPGPWPASRNDSRAAATVLVLPDTPGEGATSIRYEGLTFDTAADRDFFRVRLPNTDGACCCLSPVAGCPKKVVITVRPEFDVALDVSLYSPGSTAPIDPVAQGWAAWGPWGTEIEIVCPESVELAVPGDAAASIVNTQGEIFFSVDRTTARTLYDLEIRYEYLECSYPPGDIELIRIFGRPPVIPEYSFFPNDRGAFMDCLSNPMCDPAEEYLAVFWGGGDFRMDFVFEAPANASGVGFGAALVDQGGTVIKQTDIFDYNGLFESIRLREGPRAATVVASGPIRQSVLPGNLGIGFLVRENLPKGWYFVQVDAPFQTSYGFQIGEADRDHDLVPDIMDNCPEKPNPFQKDTDLDGPGDACDNCPVHFNPTQTDTGGTGFGNACEDAAPIPMVTANGSSYPCHIAPTDTLSVKTGLYAGNNAGEQADWWVVAVTPLGAVSLKILQETGAGAVLANLNTARWVPGVSVAFQGPLRDMAPTEILRVPPGLLPPGAYAVIFGVDTEMNGEIDPARLLYDYVLLDVFQAAGPSGGGDDDVPDEGAWIE